MKINFQVFLEYGDLGTISTRGDIKDYLWP